jgi:predicted HTH domain antitoxin
MLVINDELVKELNMSEQEIKLEFAIRLYESDKISLRKAARIASLPWLGFSKILVQRNIPTVKMSNEEFETEVSTVNSLLNDRD